MCNRSLTAWNRLTQKHCGLQRPNYLLVALVTDFVEPCVLMVTVDNKIRRIVVLVPVRNPMPTFHRSHVSDLTCYSPSKTKSFETDKTYLVARPLWHPLCSKLARFSCRNIRPKRSLYTRPTTFSMHWTLKATYVSVWPDTQITPRYILAVNAVPPCSSVVKERSTSASQYLCIALP